MGLVQQNCRAEECLKVTRGISYAILAGLEKSFSLFDPAFYCYYKTFKVPKEFEFQGHTYTYFYHRYNTTWRNERCVEVPIIWEIVQKHHDCQILEVGNTLSHYFCVDHDIVDKYEKTEGVINQDVVDFDPTKKYDLIVSISTLEHIGWDRDVRDPAKILRAIEQLKHILACGGKIVATLPIGFNSDLDKLLCGSEVMFKERHYMKRASKGNSWVEADWKDVKGAKYDHLFSGASGLIIGVIEK